LEYPDNRDYGYKSDHAKSLYSDPDPTPSELYDNVDGKNETNTRWETSIEISKYEPKGLEYKHKEPEYEAKGGEYKDKELEGDKDKIYRHREHRYEGEYECVVLEYENMGRDNVDSYPSTKENSKMQF
jgi:hypothetical protein